MLILATICAAALGILLLAQLVPAAAFCRRLRTAPRVPNGQPAGKFCVGMPLRGADPNLKAAITRILNQDYPDFELRIVVDSQTDPAWEVAHAAVKDLGAANVRISALKVRSTTCSPYCSSLAQYLDELDDSCEFVGFADGDMIVPSDWLRHMAAALADESVGATLGNRWYVPVGHRWGTLVRYLWNAGAVVPMWMFEMPWTGALALRRQTVLKTKLVDKLRCGMTEDTPVKAAVEQLGMKLRFIPQLMIPNCEETDFLRCFGFIQRQLLWTKLYHPHWWYVVFNALLSAAVMFLPFLWSAVMLAMGLWGPGLVVGIAALCYLAGMLGLLAMLESSMRHVMEGRTEPLPRFAPWMLLRLLVGVPLAQLVHLVAVLSCLGKRSVLWRGVRYHIAGPWNIQVLGEESSPAQVRESDATVSLS